MQNLNSTNSCGIVGGQLSGSFAASSISQAPYYTGYLSSTARTYSPVSNGVLYVPPPGPTSGFSCFLLTNGAGECISIMRLCVSACACAWVRARVWSCAVAHCIHRSLPSSIMYLHVREHVHTYAGVFSVLANSASATWPSGYTLATIAQTQASPQGAASVLSSTYPVCRLADGYVQWVASGVSPFVTTGPVSQAPNYGTSLTDWPCYVAYNPTSELLVKLRYSSRQQVCVRACVRVCMRARLCMAARNTRISLSILKVINRTGFFSPPSMHLQVHLAAHSAHPPQTSTSRSSAPATLAPQRSLTTPPPSRPLTPLPPPA